MNYLLNFTFEELNDFILKDLLPLRLIPKSTMQTAFISFGKERDEILVKYACTKRDSGTARKSQKASSVFDGIRNDIDNELFFGIKFHQSYYQPYFIHDYIVTVSSELLDHLRSSFKAIRVFDKNDNMTIDNFYKTRTIQAHKFKPLNCGLIESEVALYQIKAIDKKELKKHSFKVVSNTLCLILKVQELKSYIKSINFVDPKGYVIKSLC